MKVPEHIEIDARKRFGKPVLIGTRIAISDVLKWLANGMTKEEIVEDFPEVSLEGIRACLLYAASREEQHGIAS